METNSDVIRQVGIHQYKNGEQKKKEDAVVDEDILTIVINGAETFSLVFSMVNTRELAAGILFSQGIVTEPSEIVSLTFDPAQKICRIGLDQAALKKLEAFKSLKQTKGSSGGSFILSQQLARRLKDSDGLSLSPDQILALIEKHWDASQLFHQTGAVHSAGLCEKTQQLFYFEDIGRHNAVDKLAGHVLLNNVDTSDKIATLSCRMSLEIIGKIIKTGVPVVISNAAPTLSAIELARTHGITMIGFARNNRFNVYTGEQRIRSTP